MKQCPYIRTTTLVITDGNRRFHQRFRCKCTEKRDCIKKVRLSNPVSARNASKRTEPKVNIDKVLESVDF